LEYSDDNKAAIGDNVTVMVATSKDLSDAKEILLLNKNCEKIVVESTNCTVL